MYTFMLLLGHFMQKHFSFDCQAIQVAWHSKKNIGLDWRTFPVTRSTFSWWVTTYM